jgi:hypothetical protein
METADIFLAMFFRCMLSVINNAHDHKREPLINSVRQMLFDLVKTEMLTMACVNVTTGGDEKAITTVVNETAI